jgi:hypothetical protein
VTPIRLFYCSAGVAGWGERLLEIDCANLAEGSIVRVLDEARINPVNFGQADTCHFAA